MNKQDKQIDAVEKVLGDRAYEDIYIMPTANENWIELVICDDSSIQDLADQFGDDWELKTLAVYDKIVYVSNKKIAAK